MCSFFSSHPKNLNLQSDMSEVGGLPPPPLRAGPVQLNGQGSLLSAVSALNSVLACGVVESVESIISGHVVSNL